MQKPYPIVAAISAARLTRYGLAALLALTSACDDRDTPTVPRSARASRARVPSTGPGAGAILFSAGLTDGSTRPRQLYSVRPDGSELRLVSTLASGHDQFPVWSPDFNLIAFSTEAQPWEREHRHVQVVTPDGAYYGQFESGSRPRWSPDGRKLLFSDTERSLGKNSELYIGNGNGRVTQLTSTPEFEGDATWSPDGRRIAFVRFTDKESEVYVMDAGGRKPAQKITTCAQEGARCSMPSWSVIPGDERIVVYVDKTVPELRLIRADGGGASTLLSDARLEPAAPSWSPDGNSVAFASSRDATDPTTQSDVYTIDAATKLVQRVTSVGPLGQKVHSTGWSR